MPASLKNMTVRMIKIRIPPHILLEFIAWQTKLNTFITAFPGFVSLEISSALENGQTTWTIVQRFYDASSLTAWRTSQAYTQLLAEAKKILIDNNSEALQEQEIEVTKLHEGVTEVFVTQVSPDQEAAYREWIAKIHQVEAQFPGFRGTYIQAPSQNKSQHWITLLQFDTPENLDHWLSSPERQEILQQSSALISSLESHRVISPYAGWFNSLAKKGQLPPVWKQTLIVLLVLFPIIMLEFKFLSPLLVQFNSSLATFIGNAISVTLLAWPFMPIAIRAMDWWLSPKGQKRGLITSLGTLVVLGLYLLEIALFWNLIPK